MKLRLKVILLSTLIGVSWGEISARIIVPDMPSMTLPKDTTDYGEDTVDDEEGLTDQGPKRPPKDLVVNGYNALNDVMEGRYIPEGETFIKTPRWLRNFYIQGGVGYEKISAPDNIWEISPMIVGQLGIGKDFSKLHSARLMFHAATGYLRTEEQTYTKLGAKLEYLYNLSSYFAGYSPSRLFGLSAIVGVGAQFSQMTDKRATTFEGHVGAQLRFYTGPKAYISVEPYVGIGGDKMDMSGTRNWRNADMFFGANVNLVYYLDNHLSPESKRKLIESRHNRDQLSTDSLLESWQQPWFAQISNGISMMNSPALSQGSTMGPELSVSLGRWLSPVVGLRGTLYTRSNTWRELPTTDAEGKVSSVKLSESNITNGVRLEAMINPLGFLKNFYWDAPFGFYLMGGAEYGWVEKSQSQPLSCSMFGWGGGINLWYQFEHGMKVFLEPRLMHNEYRIPYTNNDWYKRYSDNYFTLNVGLAVEMRDDKRYYIHSYEDEYVTNRLRKIKVGIAGGTHFMQIKHSYSTGGGLGYNGLLFGEYHFDRLKSVRLGVEFVSLKRSSQTDFIDYNMDYPDQGNAPVERRGMWNHKYMFLLISPGAQIDLNYASKRYHPQRYRLYVFAGPTLAYVLKYSRQISELERLKLHHVVEPIDADKVGLGFGGHLGLKLTYDITPRISVLLQPTVYFLGTTKMPGIDFTKLKLLETINLGAQYSF